ncbi:MAG TPA: ComEA family DNA-binding protein [Candidatus Hydrogenedentes bacterium]|nr:ComEA family DNA-binding protein [Candidatus Hydrogenedentota bacterium]
MVSRLLTWKEQAILVAFAAAVLVGSAVLYFRSRSEPGPPVPAAVVPAQTPAMIVDVPQATVLPEPAPKNEILLLPPPPQDVQQSIVAEIKGAVKHPGVYDLAETARVEDLIQAAGGPDADADLSDINRAARLLDGAPLTIPRKGRIALIDGVATNRADPSASELNPPEYTVSGWRRGPAQSSNTQTPAVANPSGAAGSDSAIIDLNTATQAQLESLPSIGPVTARKIIDHRSHTPFATVDDLMAVHGIGPKTVETVRPFVTVSAPLQ